MVDEKTFCKHIRKGDRILKSTGKRSDAIESIAKDGLSEFDAAEIIDRIIDENKESNRAFGQKFLYLGLFGVLATVVVAAIIDRFYIIIFFASAISALLGTVEYIWPTKHKLRSEIFSSEE